MDRGPCAACHTPEQRLAIATGDCVCLVCETCANQFLGLDHLIGHFV